MWCANCRVLKVCPNAGMYTCPKCGETEWGYVEDFDRTVCLRTKTTHKRHWWMKRRLSGFLKDSFEIETIVEDFDRVVNVLIDKGLIKGRNVSKYGYYIIRLCARRGIELQKIPNDMKDGKTKDTFDDNLFGICYQELGWFDSEDEYYWEWINKKGFSLTIRCQSTFSGSGLH